MKLKLRGRWLQWPVMFGALIFVFASIVSNAQLTTADVVGTVTDTSDAVIPNAKVTLTNLGTSVTKVTMTSGTGDYTFNLLNPGQYTVTIDAKGFKKAVIPNLHLAAGDRQRQNAALQPGSIEETVEVQSSAPLLQTDSSAVQTTVTEQSVQDLPLNGRNYINLVQVQPGVNQAQPNSIAGGTRPDDRRVSSSVSANGQADFQNNQLLDGLDNNEREQGFIGVRPSIDAIAEVQVTTNNFSAEVGRTAGAVVNIITKSGTNNFHGSVYEFFRNDIFDARDFFATTGKVAKPEYRQNQFGGSIGGPIIKNKTFFFADVEENRLILGASSGQITVPTLYEQQHPGDFTDVGGPNVSTGTLDPVGLAYFKMYPKPNLSTTAATNNYTNVVKRPQNTLSLDGRIDQHLNNGDTLFGRYSYNNVKTYVPGWLPDVTQAGMTFNPGGGSGLFPGASTNLAHSFQLSYSHPFTQNLVLLLKTGFMRIGIDTANLNNGQNVSSAIGVVNANTPAAPETTGLMPISFSSGGYSNLGDSTSTPIQEVNNNFLYTAAVLYTRGAHNIKAGAQVTRRQLNYYQSGQPLGSVSFSGGTTGNAMADLLTGKPVGYTRTNLIIKPGFRSWETGYYVQDDWRLNSRITLNLGFRYDMFTPFSEVLGRSANFDFPSMKLIQGSSDPNIGVRTNHSNYGPRVGFSASILPKTVLRGGYGITYIPTDIESLIQEQNPPFYFTARCNPSSLCGGFTWPNLPVPTPSSTTNLTGGLQYKSSNFNTSQVQMFNLMFQQQVGANVITVGGIGELGRHVIYRGAVINLPAPNGPYPTVATTGPPVNPAYTTLSALPNVTSITSNQASATSNYYAFQAVFARRMTKGLEFNANYTWAHDLTDGFIGSGSPGGVAAGLLPNNPRYDYGNASVDIRHRFATTLTYTMPFGKNAKGLQGALIKGWNSNIVFFWQTGQMFAATNSFTNANKVAQVNLPGITADRPNIVPGQSWKAANPTRSQWLNLSAFTPQPAGTLGNERSFQFAGPNTRRADLSVTKTFPLPETMSLQFRAEAYNISNTPNFQPPAAAISGWSEGQQHDFLHPIKVGNSGFCTSGVSGCKAVGLLPGDVPTAAGGLGATTSTVTNVNPRQFQFALKLLF